MDLTEAEGIINMWQEYSQELYKKNVYDADNQDGVITHLEPESWSVKWGGPLAASPHAKLVEVMEFQLSSFKS